MRVKAYCALFSIHDHWRAEVHEQMSRSGGQSEANPLCLVPKQAWYSYIIPLKGWKAESTLPSPRREFRNCGVEARYPTTQPLASWE
ncbi:hypothetical protein TNCV_2003381 [Trichonephila clavipes]|nr:hypothetical protein TNCV_2003381 [Trichonephila clavipes]